jgi:hypothetical protein
MKNTFECVLTRPRHDAGKRSRFTLLIAGALLAATGGCSSIGAKPWQHDLLAEQAMQVDAAPLESAIDDHVYFSKEASSGGRSFAGGGCGCN